MTKRESRPVREDEDEQDEHGLGAEAEVFFLCVTLRNQEMNRSDYLSEFVSIMTIKLHRESRSRSTQCQHAIPYRCPWFTSI